MKFFACVLDTVGQGIGDDVRRRVQSMAINRLLNYRWDSFDRAAVLTGWDEFGGAISIERYGDWVAVGEARLDNRAEIERLAQLNGASSRDESDLAVTLRLIAYSGTKYIPTLLGDFGFVAWHAASRTVVGACDAFNAARLYYTQHRGVLLIGSRAEPLSMTDTYDVGYLAELLTQDFRMREHTVYTGVTQLSAGSTLTVRDGHLIIQAYWSVADFEAERRAKISEADAIATCRDLLITSIRLRLDPGGRNWSQLSGGIDSSAVVSIVQWLAEQGSVPHGLDGTLTFVIGSQTASDERVFSDEVVKRWGIRNDVVVDAPMWFDDTDDAGIPLPDQPLLTLIHAPIDGRFRAILREAGARVLLTGWGSDQLFTGGPIYFADRLVQGQVSQVLGELAHRAALERGSFWKLAFDNLVKPYIPVEVRRFVRPSQSELPTWLRKDTLQRVGSTKQPDSVSEGRIGRKYDHWHASGIADAQRAEETRALAEVVSVRHPFLYRPLVEFALRLPAELCARPHSKKWVLRQAVKGILPEVVRTRVGKGGGGDSFVRMFAQQRAFIKQLAHDPILAELGLIDARRFMTAVDECSNSRTSKQAIWGEVMKTLIVEAWLQVRSGRWPHGFAMPRIPVIPQQDTHQLTVTQRRFV